MRRSEKQNMRIRSSQAQHINRDENFEIGERELTVKVSFMVIGAFAAAMVARSDRDFNPDLKMCLNR